MCDNKKDLVKYAPTIESYKSLLKKFNFEFILIDQLEGVQLGEILKIINLKYKNKK